MIVAEDLQEEFLHSRVMKDFHEESIVLPKSAKYYPSLESLNWHRTNIFNAGF
jgi:putative restriction endonuclease